MLNLKRSSLAFVLSLAAITSSALAQDPREANFVKSMGLGPNGKVTYQSDSGESLSFDAFLRLAVAGRTFSTIKDTAENTAVAVLDPAGGATAKPNNLPRASKGDSIPSFHLKDLNRAAMDNASLKGSYTLVNFLYSECGPCIAEIPVLNAFARSHARLKVFAVTFDSRRVAKAFTRERHLAWPLLADGKGFIDAMGVTVYPTMALVGPDGRLLGIATSSQIGGSGRSLTAQGLSAWVASLMKPGDRIGTN